jgi:hypothetical protein
MDTIACPFSDKFLPIALQEIDSNSDVGPYDDDGEAKQYSAPDLEIDRLLKARISMQAQQPKSS